MSQLTFGVRQDPDGGFVAEALGENIFTQGDTWDELRANVQDAVEGFYFDSTAPPVVRLHFVRDELLKIA